MNIKGLLKNKKLMIGAAAVLVVGVVTATVLLLPHGSPPLETDPNSSSGVVSVQPPTVSAPDDTSSAPEEESSAPGKETEVSDIEVKLEPQTPTTSSKPTGNGGSGKAEEPAKPVTIVRDLKRMLLF